MKRQSIRESADYGAGHIRRRGRIEAAIFLAAGQGVTLLDIADIDHPDRRQTKRVAMREDPLWLILGALRTQDGRLTWTDDENPRRHFAAETLRDDAAEAVGIKRQSIMDALAGYSFGARIAPTDPSGEMIDAQTRCREAWTAVRGPDDDTRIEQIVRMIVLGYYTLGDVQKVRRCSYAIAKRGLLLGLDRLVAHFGC